MARVFIRLGTTAFGGPAVHIALMQDEVVKRRAWLTQEQFLDLLGAVNLIPGPNSTELAIHIGRQRAGWRGLLVAGSCFILPAAIIATVLAWSYSVYGSLPAFGALLYGIKPAVIAIVLQAIVLLSRSAVKNAWLAVLGLLCVCLSFAGIHELVIVFGSGVLCSLPIVWRRLRPKSGTLHSIALLPIFFVFVKIGSVLFGSGYVLLAFLRTELVERRAWLTEARLLDAVAIGQIVPGPVFTTATFIGYALAGLPGAAVATAGIFAPAFFFVAVTAPIIGRLRQSAVTSALLDGVNTGSLALMVAVTLPLGRAALIDLGSILIAVASAVGLLWLRLNPVWLIGGGGAVGLLVRLLR